MRYELRLEAFTILDQAQIRLTVDGTPDNPEETTWRVLAMTASSRISATPEAKEWTREVLETMLEAL